MKKFSKVAAAVAAVSMLVSVSPAVNACESFTDKTGVYLGFEYRIVNDFAVITGFSKCCDEIPDINTIDKIAITDVVVHNDTNYPVYGIDDFAFAGLESLTEMYLPDSIQPAFVGNAAFITNASIRGYAENVLGDDPTETDVLTYIANTVYGEKESWTEEELAAVKEKVYSKASLAGVELNDEMTDDEYIEAAIVILQNQDEMNLSETVSNNLAVFETTIPYADGTNVYVNEGSAMDEYFESDNQFAPPVSVIPALYGDANADGSVNVRDAAFIASKLAKAEGDDLPDLADFNRDTTVNIRDAAAIASALAKGEL